MLGGRPQQAFQRRIGQLSARLQRVIEHDGEYSNGPPGLRARRRSKLRLYRNYRNGMRCRNVACNVSA
jgi:hypothetical protein